MTDSEDNAHDEADRGARDSARDKARDEATQGADGGEATPQVRPWWERALLSRPAEFMIPTLSTWYFNRSETRASRVPTVSPADWSNRARYSLLERSERRLQEFEVKAPIMAVLSLLVLAIAVLAICGGWDESNWVGKLLLLVAAAFAAFSLVFPFYLLGHQPRATVEFRHLRAAGKVTGSPEAEEVLAAAAGRAAARNEYRALRLANLQEAARNELATALLALGLWALFVPAWGVLDHDRNGSADRKRDSATTTGTTSTGPAVPSSQPGKPATKPVTKPKPRG